VMKCDLAMARKQGGGLTAALFPYHVSESSLRRLGGSVEVVRLVDVVRRPHDAVLLKSGRESLRRLLVENKQVMTGGLLLRRAHDDSLFPLDQ
jgi:hypothetical protein